MRRINVQVRGIDPANKGACLMAAAVQQELARHFDRPRVGVDIAMPFEERMRMGFWAITPENWDTGMGPGRLKGLAVRQMAKQSRKLGLLRTDEIDVILDASGFAYGDFWGKAKFDARVARPMPVWKAAGKTVIALPQAWGAFEEAGFADSIRTTLSQADLVFARDRVSLAYLEGTGLQDVTLAPDFTNLLAPALPVRYEDLRGAGFVIPNTKMLEAHGDGARAGYLEFLRQAVVTLQKVCPVVHILVHEGAKDLALSNELNASLPTPLRIVDPADALDTKAILSHASALISSRFHGLVSALSAGVPSMACGWSHKYKELMDDYGSARHVVDLDAPDGWGALLQEFAADIQDVDFKTQLSTAAQTQKDRSKASWKIITETIAAQTGVTQAGAAAVRAAS